MKRMWPFRPICWSSGRHELWTDGRKTYCLFCGRKVQPK